MDGEHGSVCPGGENDKMFAVSVLSAASGQKKEFPLFFTKSIFDFVSVPFIKTLRGDGNASVAYALTEERFFQNRFTSGIENELFFPVRRQGKPPF